MWLVMALVLGAHLSASEKLKPRSGCHTGGREHDVDRRYCKCNKDLFLCSTYNVGEELYETTKSMTSGNQVISPLAVQHALQILVEGARGRTQRDILEGLFRVWGYCDVLPQARDLHNHFRGISKNHCIRANSLLVIGSSDGFLSDYLKTIDNQFVNSNVKFNNMRSMQIEFINNWVFDETGSEISNLLNTGNTVGYINLAVVSIIDFHGIWESKFNTSNTRTAYRCPNKNNEIMHLKGVFNYKKIDEMEVISIPFNEPGVRMVIVTPGNPVGDEPQRYDALDTVFPEKRYMELKIPKIIFHKKYFNLIRNIRDMGILPNETMCADLSGLSLTERFSINLVEHKTYIRIDESGVRAYGAVALLSNANVRSTRETEAAEPSTAHRSMRFYIITHDLIAFEGSIQDMRQEE